MTHEQARRISSTLLFRYRKDPEVQAALMATFGRAIVSRKYDPILRKKENRDMLALFWLRLIDRNEAIAKVAYRTAGVHTNVGTHYRADQPIQLDLKKRTDSPKKKNTRTQPGDILASIILQLTGRSAMKCGRCGIRVATMNKWGWVGCWTNRKMIVEWLIEEAQTMGYATRDGEIMPLFVAAFRESRKKTGQTKPCLSLRTG